MIDSISIATTDYLNARPLNYGLEEGMGRNISLVYRSPSECADLFREGTVDAALIPTIEYHTVQDALVLPHFGIGSRGAVKSVILAGNKPLEAMQTIAVTNASRTTYALVQTMYRLRHRRYPELFRLPDEDLLAQADHYDGLVLIGDRALEGEDNCQYRYDLGALWTSWTAEPLVFALWCLRPNPSARQIGEWLEESAMIGLAKRQSIAEAWAVNHRHPAEVYSRYLTDHIIYDLDPEMLQGLQTFFRLCEAAGVLSGVPTLRFLEPTSSPEYEERLNW